MNSTIAEQPADEADLSQDNVAIGNGNSNKEYYTFNVGNTCDQAGVSCSTFVDVGRASEGVIRIVCTTPSLEEGQTNY